MSRIEKILDYYGPMLSGRLAQIYEEKYKTTNDAARKAISRARSPVQKIKCFPYENNQVFCYLEKQYNTEQYCELLYESLKEKSVTISVILKALENNYGIMSKKSISVFSVSPIYKTKGHRLFSRNMSDLLKIGIVQEYDENHWEISDRYLNYEQYNIHLSNSNDKMSRIIVNDFISWAAKLNIIAYNSAKILPDIAEFAHFQWVATCPSYMQPLYDLKEKKPGFIVIDVIYGKQATMEDVRFFIEKVKIIRHFNNIPQFLPILLIESASADVFRTLKEEKIFIGVINNIFDEQYTKILFDVFNVFKNATAIMMNDSSTIDELLDTIKNNEGRFNNVVGDLFEYMVGSFYQRLGVSYFEMNKLIPNSRGSKNEMDILVCKDNKIIVVECKATKSPLSYEYVEKWLSEIIPVFGRWISMTYPQRHYEFQIWSVGGFDDNALELLENHKKMTKKYSLEFYDKAKMVNYAKESNDKIFLKHINNHFSIY